MFSIKEKQWLAGEVEKLVLSLHHPEMPAERPKFTLHVDGREAWSFADIQPNWTFGVSNPPGVNPWNERVRKGGA